MRRIVGIALAVLFATPVMAGVQPAASGRLMLVSNPAQTQLRISVSRMAAGAYDVVLDGAVVDTLVVNAKGKGTVQHRSRQASRRTSASPLLYDPRGGVISIASAGTTLLEGDVPGSPEEGQEHVEIEADLVNLGVIAGEAEASFEARSGRMQFEVEVEGLPTGDYDLKVDGVVVASLHVGIDNEGSVEFDSIPGVGDEEGESGEEGGELDNLLTFDPRGKTIAIAQDGIDLFSAVFPTVSTGDEDDEDDDDQGEDDGDHEGDDDEGEGGDF